ncbi:hypothetical protein [Amylibacter sp. IMCC11727]|uniref:hypothetical protein n=1 Tax=Amylibacter sp. IMCC11727 TaxID=3039851 RepID=UPI00244DC7BD|nr:hypothetical protein [Amylibacter sp. IMCC11727]WGI23382.1 hypothetical protein QBD29_08135 [Amylibacter sp. IMCC11727]
MPITRTFIAASIAGCTAFASAAQASETETRQTQTVACLSKMDNGTTWEQCRTMMFEPCAELELGSAPHLACLKSEKADWRVHLDANITKLNSSLSMDGAAQLTELLVSWNDYLGKKCSAVAESRKGAGQEAAYVGCEISEYAGVAAEFDTCLSGKSLQPYCKFQQ